MHKEKTEVLVVGAGPVGMFTALSLARAGVKVRVIDQEERTATHSYACALHPKTLELLADEDLALSSEGTQISTIAIYDERLSHVELSLMQLHRPFRHVLVLPQSELEQMLEQKLREQGIHIEWNHRLTAIKTDSADSHVLARVDRMAESGKGYAYPDFDWEVVRTFDISADFLVAADGHNSRSRHFLGIPHVPVGPSRTFVLYEFESDMPLRDELRIVLHQGGNVIWPIEGNRCRWTFEMKDRAVEEFPGKDRSPFLIEDPARDRECREALQALCHERARWFRGRIGEIYWAARVQFQPGVVQRFGTGRCWLIGDAAHQTSPIGVQSLNIGFREAHDLGHGIADVLQKRGSLDGVTRLMDEYRDEWRRMLSAEVVPMHTADPWIAGNAATILSSLPASGEDLEALLRQLQLEFHPRQLQHV